MGIYADALFTKTQQRVLGLLFAQPHRSFYANEIIALAQSGSGAVQRELARLELAGLVTVKRIGNQKHYQANHAAPIFAELRGLVQKTFGLVDVLRASLVALAPDIALAFVYGSIAKDNDHAGSDIDLLVIGQNVSHATLLGTLSPASEQLGRTINPTLYTQAEFTQRVRKGTSFIQRIIAQPKLFVLGSEHDVSRLSGARELGPHREVEDGAS